MNRRQFLKTTAIAGTALAITTTPIGEDLFGGITPEEVKAQEEVQSFVNLGGGWGVTPMRYYVKNGRIFRVRPLIVPPEEVKPQWKIEIDGKVYEATERLGKPAPAAAGHDNAMRTRPYSPYRIRYPMKRVDWSPTNRNTQNRGESDFIRIEWDEALTTVASELTRVNQEYGPSGIYQSYYSHTHPWNQIQDPNRSFMNRVFCAAFGGHTRMGHSPDSWEGFAYGASFVWGNWWAFGQADKGDMFEDVLRNGKLVLHWSNDTLGQSADAAEWTTYQHWFKERGIRRIYITPDLNWGAIAYGDKWIPILPGTDAALACAIAHVWLTEGTYFKEYVYTHGYGFDEWKDYVLGVEDGIPKTPKWAEPLCGVKARVIKALARDWASNPTSTAIGPGGTACRVPYGHEWSRMYVYLHTMQGLGKPGRGIHGGLAGDTPGNRMFWPYGIPESWGNLTWMADNIYQNNVTQACWRTSFPTAILDPPIEWYGWGLSAVRAPPPGLVPKFEYGSQWGLAGVKNVYPKEGYSKIHLQMAAGSHILGTWTEANKWIQAWQSPELEFIYRTDYWWGGAARFSDIILPVTTCLEQNDVSGPMRSSINPMQLYRQQVIEPMWEAKPELWIEGELAKKLDVYEEWGEGNTEDDWIRKWFEHTAMNVIFHIPYEEWKQKGYNFFPFQEVQTFNPGYRWYADLPEGDGMDTASGKLEFFSQHLYDWFGDDPERPPVAHYQQSWEGLETPLAEKYPLLVDSPHPRFRFHTQNDESPWIRECIGHKIKGPDGYYYEALWMNPVDAALRGIEHGDIVRCFNDRGQLLMGAYVNERMMQGVVRSPDGGFYDPVNPGDPYSLDKGGCMNVLTPIRFHSKHASSFTVSGYLCEVEKWVGPLPTSVSERTLTGGG